MALELNINNQKRVYKDILPDKNADDRAYVEILQKIAQFTMLLNSGAEATYSLFHNIKYITENKVPGAIIECGVWRGGASMLMALALQHFGDSARDLYLYDTYAGMTEPDEIDIDYDGKPMKPVWQNAQKQGGMIGFGGTVSDVKNNMISTGYAETQLHLIEGDVLETIPATMPEEIALLRLDTDWHKSTLHELEHMYPKLVKGGILIIDDYGWCEGARKATDEYFAAQPQKPLLHRINQSVRVAVKI